MFMGVCTSSFIISSYHMTVIILVYTYMSHVCMYVFIFIFFYSFIFMHNLYILKYMETLLMESVIM